MASFAGASKTIVIRTSRETLGLVVAATAVTLALATAVHSKHQADASASAPVQQIALAAPDASPQEDWAGHLAELTPAAAPKPAEPLTSASLTVPRARLALPTTPRPLPKPRPCVEPQPCALKALAATASPPVLPHHQTAVREQGQAQREHRSLIGVLNPLAHLPDMSTVSRPFTYAGGAMAGWFKRL